MSLFRVGIEESYGRWPGIRRACNPSCEALSGIEMLGDGIEHLPLTTQWLISVTFAWSAVTTAPSAESSSPRRGPPNAFDRSEANETVSNQPPSD